MSIPKIETMGFLDNFLKAQAPLQEGWKELQELKQLDQLIEDSHQKPVVIFKHSVSCGISAMAKHQLERDWDFDPADLDFYYLDLINNRAVSNQIAETLGVIHQSPQIILVHKGKEVYNTSHHMISVQGLKKAL